jgi:hypothetical protein
MLVRTYATVTPKKGASRLYASREERYEGFSILSLRYKSLEASHTLREIYNVVISNI